jgi:hypothetical protein
MNARRAFYHSPKCIAIASKFCATAKSKEIAWLATFLLPGIKEDKSSAIFANLNGLAMRPCNKLCPRGLRLAAALAAMQKTLEIDS